MDQPTEREDDRGDVEPRDEVNDRRPLDYPNPAGRGMQLDEPGNSGP